MIAKTGIVLVALCAFALADRNPYRAPAPRSYTPPRAPAYTPPRTPSYTPPRPTYDSSDDSFEQPKYVFDWEVNEAYNQFEQEEQRDDDNTRGSYSVDLPDGRRQTVTYYVDGDSGFVAEVSYDGEAQFPESREYSAPRPAYQAPRTTPRPAYQPPRTTPRQSYQPPRTTPRPSYQAPRTTRRPSYQPPRNTYQAPRPSPPRNAYSAPNSLLAAFGF